jgi:AcrR family transcriptional regulator
MRARPKAKATKKVRKTGAVEARQTAYRGLILDAAERVFATKGFDGAKIKDVADAAGLALGTVYVLFPSKRDVFAAVHANRGEALLARAVEVAADAPTPLASLCLMQRAACEFYAAHPAYLRMHLFSGTSWAAPRLDVEEETVIYERGVAALVSIFERAAKRGELVTDESPRSCARMCLAICQVLLSEWEAESLATPPADVAARFERHLMRGIGRPSAPKAAPTARRTAAAR